VEVMVIRIFKKCSVSDEMDRMEDGKQVGNVGSEHYNVHNDYETRFEVSTAVTMMIIIFWEMIIIIMRQD
jgi:hypothetical protein